MLFTVSNTTSSAETIDKKLERLLDKAPLSRLSSVFYNY